MMQNLLFKKLAQELSKAASPAKHIDKTQYDIKQIQKRRETEIDITPAAGADIKEISTSGTGNDIEQISNPAAESDISAAPSIKDVADLKLTADEDMKDQILSLNLRSPKSVDPSKYNSDKILEPKNEADRQKYLLIYTEYVSKALTQKQLAENHKYSITHVNRIIKWASFQIGRLDDQSELIAMIDYNQIRIQEIQSVKNDLLLDLKELRAPAKNPEEAKLKKKRDDNGKTKSNLISDIGKCWKAEMQVTRLLSQIKKLMNGTVIEMQDNRSVNTFKLAPGFSRRTGSSFPKQNDIKEISASGTENDITRGSDPATENDINRDENHSAVKPIINISRGHGEKNKLQEETL